MGDTTVGKLAKADAVIPGIYSVYIDQDDKEDKYTVRSKRTYWIYESDDRTNFDRNKCLNEYHAFEMRVGLITATRWFTNNFTRADVCPEVSPVNSFELASKTPIRKSVFKNANGEEFKVGSTVIFSNAKKDSDKQFRSMFVIGLFDDIYQDTWEITGFKIAGFTDDPERKKTENMSNVPDEKRKYAVIEAELLSTTHAFSTYTALLNDLQTASGAARPQTSVHEFPNSKPCPCVDPLPRVEVKDGSGKWIVSPSINTDGAPTATIEYKTEF